MKLTREQAVDLMRNQSDLGWKPVDRVYVEDTRWSSIFEYVFLDEATGIHWQGTFVDPPEGLGWHDTIEKDVSFVRVTQRAKTIYVWDGLETY